MSAAFPGYRADDADTVLAIEPIRCMRRFRAPVGGLLRSLHTSYIFTTGENRADCRRAEKSPREGDPYARMVDEWGRPPQAEALTGSAGHDYPECSCGFYAYHDMGEDDEYGQFKTAAVVDCYGDVIVGTKGVRCTRLRIVALSLPRVERVPGSIVPLPTRPDLAEPMRGARERQHERERVWHLRHEGGCVMTPAEREFLVRSFPDVPIFEDDAAMLAAFPLSGPGV